MICLHFSIIKYLLHLKNSASREDATFFEGFVFIVVYLSLWTNSLHYYVLKPIRRLHYRSIITFRVCFKAAFTFLGEEINEIIQQFNLVCFVKSSSNSFACYWKSKVKMNCNFLILCRFSWQINLNRNKYFISRFFHFFLLFLGGHLFTVVLKAILLII